MIASLHLAMCPGPEYPNEYMLWNLGVLPRSASTFRSCLGFPGAGLSIRVDQAIGYLEASGALPACDR